MSRSYKKSPARNILLQAVNLALLGDTSTIVQRIATLERQVALGVDQNQISSEEMMEMLRTTNQTVAENPEAVVIFSKITSNPVYKEIKQPDGTINHELYVLDPHGEVWHWNEEERTWK